MLTLKYNEYYNKTCHLQNDKSDIIETDAIICSKINVKKLSKDIIKIKNNILFLVCFMFLMLPSFALAHPGRTDGNGCHYCRTNCSKWGLKNNEYHCHGGSKNTTSKGSTNKGSTSSGSKNNNSTSQSSTSKETTKNSDNSLKNIFIDGNKIQISNEMKYTTYNEKVEILVETSDSKATYNVENKILKLGDNNIEVKVTAEDGKSKKYNLLITRELSNNTNIEIIVNDEKIIFSNGKATINVSSDTEKINYEYNLEDKNAKIEIDDIDNLNFGNNFMSFKVIAPDNSEKIYELTIYKYTKTEEILSTILGLGMVGGIGYGAYYFLKQRNKK